MLKIILFITGFLTAVLCFSQENSSGMIKDCSVTAKVLSPPSSGDQDTSTGKKWMAICVEFTTVKEINKNNPNGYQFCDELELIYEAVITEPSLNKDYYLSGKVQLANVCFDGNKKNTVAYIPPPVIDRIKLRKTPFDKKYLSNIYIRVIILINGEKAAQAYLPSKVDGIETVFSNKMANLKIEKLKDSIIGRANTPWIGMNFDKNEWEKTNP